MWLYWNGRVKEKNTEQPIQEARAHVLQPLCGAGPGGITAGHGRSVGGSPAHAETHAQMFYSVVIQQTYQNVCVCWGKKKD